MIDHAARENGLATLLETLSARAEGSDPSITVECTWEKNPQAGAFIDPATQARVYLSTISAVNYGTASVEGVWSNTEEYEGVAGSFSDTITRPFTWTVRVRVEALDASPEFHAFAWCERMRTRLARRSSHAALNAFGCALQTAGQSQDLTAIARTVDNRSANVAAFDLVLNTCDIDLDPERYPNIATVELSATVDETDLGIVGEFTLESP